MSADQSRHITRGIAKRAAMVWPGSTGLPSLVMMPFGMVDFVVVIWLLDVVAVLTVDANELPVLNRVQS